MFSSLRNIWSVFLSLTYNAEFYNQKWFYVQTFSSNQFKRFTADFIFGGLIFDAQLRNKCASRNHWSQDWSLELTLAKLDFSQSCENLVGESGTYIYERRSFNVEPSEQKLVGESGGSFTKFQISDAQRRNKYEKRNHEENKRPSKILCAKVNLKLNAFVP